MTESTAPGTGGYAAPHAASSGSGWLTYPLGLGILGFVVAFIVAFIPPAHSATAAGEIVNFPAMFGQYVLAILVGLLSTVLLLVGLIAHLFRSRT